MGKDIVLELSERIRSLRIKNNFTQEALAEKADMGTRTLQDLEGTNPRCPTVQTLQKLARAFDMTLSQLFKGL